MQINELFVKPVDRPIEGVIKADDHRFLLSEVEEFVVTREISRGLDQFTERYLNETNANGVWISGFFGSGKSHLLKIISLILDKEPLADGVHPVEIILPKIEDEILRGDLQRAAKIPSKSVLFNIDQKADGIGGDHTAAILEVFVKVLNEMQGYYGNQGYIAEFEYQLDKEDQLDPFKETYQRVNDRAWEQDRDALATVRKSAFAKAYTEHFQVPEEEAYKVLGHMRDDYKMSIESFARRVKTYLDKQEPDFRLNFFVDEVGQFVGQEPKLMLNLQTVAETLGTVCEGRAWVFVTSQGDLQKILGELKGTASQDFTKIQGRFKTRLTLSSADVREVIQKRLLAKQEEEPEVLTRIYDREKDNMETLYRFGDNSVTYKNWRGSDEFCDFYPFHPYQFDLFQRCIEQLSKHDAFTGKHTSVGERSMLEVFQSVAKAIRHEEVGELATFDLMFDGIAATIRGDLQTSIRQAERQLDNGTAIRILKALFLLKWVREFKSTPRNVAILLIKNPHVDIRAHETEVKEALDLLAGQSYLQRQGEVYEFLTDTEKDIEIEIKNTQIDESQMTKLMSDTLFSNILREPKIRYEGNGQDYAYKRMLDGQLVGRDADIGINIITPDHPNHGDLRTLAAQNTGKAELLVILPADLRLVDEARLYLKTAKYCLQNMGGTIDASRRAILTERGQQNAVRNTQLQERCSELLSKAPIFIDGSQLDGIGEGEARNRLIKASQQLIANAFPNLRMLKGRYDEATLREALLEKDDLLPGSEVPPSEAENEVLHYVMRNQNNSERTTVEELLRNFNKRPYGWYDMAVLTLIGRLFRMGKLELRTTELLDSKKAFELMKNSRQHGGIRVRLQEQFDTAKVNALKKFHQEFFDRLNDGTDARSVGEDTQKAIAEEVRALASLLNQASNYSFLLSLQPLADTLSKLAGRDYGYLLNHLKEFEDELLQAKEDLLDPIKAFMNGGQRKVYDDVMIFLNTEAANFEELPKTAIESLMLLRESQAPYRGSVIPSANKAKSTVQGLIGKLLEEEKAKALSVIEEHQTRITELKDFKSLDEDDQNQVLSISRVARQSIEEAQYLTSIRDRLNRYQSQDYPAQLTLLSKLSSAKSGDGKDGGDKPAITYTPASQLRPKCSIHYIRNEQELDEWLAALRQSAQEELKKGNHISL